MTLYDYLRTIRVQKLKSIVNSVAR